MPDNGSWKSAAERREAMQATVTRATLKIKNSARGANEHLSNIRDELIEISTGLKVLVWSIWVLIAVVGVFSWKHWG
jgi:hypothetical protein